MYRLRELERRDLAEINKWRNDPELIALLGAPFRFISMPVDERWYENYINNRGNAVRCAIIGEDDEIIGIVSLTNVDYVNQSAVFHIMIGDAAEQGKGAGKFAGKFAVNAMLEHAFLNMNLYRIELSVLEDNARARHVYEKAGFKSEGMKRNSVYKNGKFVSMCIYSILKDEFLKIGGGGV